MRFVLFIFGALLFGMLFEQVPIGALLYHAWPFICVGSIVFFVITALTYDGGSGPGGGDNGRNRG